MSHHGLGFGSWPVDRQHPSDITGECVMPYAVDFNTVSTVGLESSPVAAALAGLRAHEARYFKNKYDHVFTVEPASNAKTTIDTRPVFPSPAPPGWNQRRFGAPPELRTPPSPAAHVRGGDRPSSTDLELPLNSHPSISNPVVHSMRATSRRTANGRCAATRGPRLAFTSARMSRACCRGWLLPRSGSAGGRGQPAARALADPSVATAA
jgi:hypothetical protein